MLCCVFMCPPFLCFYILCVASMYCSRINNSSCWMLLETAKLLPFIAFLIEFFIGGFLLLVFYAAKLINFSWFIFRFWLGSINKYWETCKYLLELDWIFLKLWKLITSGKLGSNPDISSTHTLSHVKRPNFLTTKN